MDNNTAEGHTYAGIGIAVDLCGTYWPFGAGFAMGHRHPYGIIRGRFLAMGGRTIYASSSCCFALGSLFV